MRFENTEETFRHAYYYGLTEGTPRRGQLVIPDTGESTIVAVYIGSGASEWLLFAEAEGSDLLEFNDDEFTALCEAFDKLFGGA